MKEKERGNTLFAKRIYELRKERDWSQPELGKMIGTSGAIIGRYERAEMSPSIDVARKLAEVFGVTVDYLISDKEMPNTLKDTEMLSRWQTIEKLSAEDRNRILYVVDSLVRDARAREAYGR